MAGGAERISGEVSVILPITLSTGGMSRVNKLDHDGHLKEGTADLMEMATVWLGGPHQRAQVVDII